MSISFTLNGADEFQQKLNTLISKYPDESEVFLKKMGNKFRTEVKKETPVGKSKKHLINRYTVAKPTGYGANLHVDFYSKSPHFHLVERGHRIVNKRGIYQGKDTKGVYMVQKTADKWKASEYPKEVEKLLNKMLKGLN